MRWFASCIVFAIPLFLADLWSTVVAGALPILWNPIHKDREMEKDLTVLCNISTHLHTGEAKKYISGWNTGDGQYPKFEAKAFLRRREMDVKVDPSSTLCHLTLQFYDVFWHFFILSVYECRACIFGCASEDVRSLGHHHVGAGNQTWVLLITKPSLQASLWLSYSNGLLVYLASPIYTLDLVEDTASANDCRVHEASVAGVLLSQATSHLLSSLGYACALRSSTPCALQQPALPSLFSLLVSNR